MGQRQRLRIAMTFLPSREVVLLDEPLTSLDGQGAGVLDAGDRGADRARRRRCCGARPAASTSTAVFDRAWILEDGRLVDRHESSRQPSVRAFLAVMRRDLHVYLSYRTRLVSQVLTSLFSLTLFYYVSRLVHLRGFTSPASYFALRSRRARALVSVMYSCFLDPRTWSVKSWSPAPSNGSCSLPSARAQRDRDDAVPAAAVVRDGAR